MTKRSNQAAPAQLIDICARLLSDQGLHTKRERIWLTTDIQAQLDIVSHWCACTIRSKNVKWEQATLELEIHQVSPNVDTTFSVTRADRTQQDKVRETTRIARSRARSAAILNMLMALLTTVVVICLRECQFHQYNMMRDEELTAQLLP